MIKETILNKSSLTFLEKYLNNAAPTGYEWESQKIWMEYLKPYVDTFITDTYGSAVGVINPDAKYKVVIEGHASNIGNPAYNMRLSERRAKSVANILTGEGVEASRITSVGYGVTRLRVQGNTPEAHAANQRIEAKVTAKVKEPVLR